MINNLMTSEEFDSSIKTNKDLNPATTFHKKNEFKPIRPKQTKSEKNEFSKESSESKLDENFDPIFDNEDDIEQYGIKQGKTRANNLKVMFLGGIGEIGKNMTVLEYGKDIIVIDCGVEFPTSDLLGIDLVVPDITYLVQNKEKNQRIFDNSRARRPYR